MKHIKISILLSVLFLSGCAFHGIMPAQYDGEELARDESSIDAYINNGQIMNVNESRYPYIESTTLVDAAGVVSGSADGETETLEAGSYSVPEDLEAGVYMLEIGREVSSSAVVVYDSEDVRILETSLIRDNNIAYVILDEGYRLEFKTRFGTADITPIQAEEISSEESVYIPPGMYSVGEQVPAGEYQLISEELLLMRQDGTPEVYWNSYGESYEYRMERTMSDDYRPEELEAIDNSIVVNVEAGDVIIAQKFLVLTEQ